MQLLGLISKGGDGACGGVWAQARFQVEQDGLVVVVEREDPKQALVGHMEIAEAVEMVGLGARFVERVVLAGLLEQDELVLLD